MRTVEVRQPRADQLVVRQGADWVRAGAVLLSVAGAVSVMAFGGISSLVGGLTWLVSLAAFPGLGVVLKRSLERRQRSVVRTPGRLLLDGEPLELARLELRVSARWLTKMPRGYVLSLWVLTTSGPEDITMGFASTLLDATLQAGALEDFLGRANLRQVGRTTQG